MRTSPKPRGIQWNFNFRENYGFCPSQFFCCRILFALPLSLCVQQSLARRGLRSPVPGTSSPPSILPPIWHLASFLLRPSFRFCLFYLVVSLSWICPPLPCPSGTEEESCKDHFFFQNVSFKGALYYLGTVPEDDDDEEEDLWGLGFWIDGLVSVLGFQGPRHVLYLFFRLQTCFKMPCLEASSPIIWMRQEWNTSDSAVPLGNEHI
jgi:hypothetical protein